MIWMKACPRCDGDLVAERDIHGSYISCLACGYYLTEVEEVVLRYAARREAGARSEKDGVRKQEPVSPAA